MRELVLQLASGFESTVISKLILVLWVKRDYKFSVHRLCSGELCFLLMWQEALNGSELIQGAPKQQQMPSPCWSVEQELGASAEAAQRRSLAVPGRPCVTRICLKDWKSSAGLDQAVKSGLSWHLPMSEIPGMVFSLRFVRFCTLSAHLFCMHRAKWGLGLHLNGALSRVLQVQLYFYLDSWHAGGKPQQSWNAASVLL